MFGLVPTLQPRHECCHWADLSKVDHHQTRSRFGASKSSKPWGASPWLVLCTLPLGCVDEPTFTDRGVASWSGGLQGSLNQDSTSYQICLEKEQETSKCWIVSISCHKARNACCGAVNADAISQRSRPIFVDKLEEELDARWRPSFPDQLPSFASLCVPECGEVSRLGWIAATCSPSPYELIWLVCEYDSLGPAPDRQVLAYFMDAKSVVNVTSPVMIL
jgi:hypothetical protein